MTSQLPPPLPLPALLSNRVRDMLGKLFNLSASGTGASPGAAPGAQPLSSKPVSSLESVQEDIHTRGLLFPDPEALYQHQNDQVFPLSTAPTPASSFQGGAFDYDGEIDLDARDVRVLIMQDALSSIPSSLLYDSQAPPPLPSTTQDRPSTTAGLQHVGSQDMRRGPASPRKPSIGHSSRPLIIQPDSPQLRLGAFDRRPSAQGRSQPRVETEMQRAYREYTEELAAFSSCIFGNSELLAYKGTSTKVHLIPADPRADPSASLAHDGRGSLGRSSVRSSKLSQSFSSDTATPLAPLPTPTGVARASDRRKVLITRLFPVALPNDDGTPLQATATATPGRFAEDSGGFPFPLSSGDPTGKAKKHEPKQKRTPMYAVALIVNLPQSVSSTSQTIPTPKAPPRASSSFTEQDSFSSSYGSARPSGWTMVGAGLGIDSPDATFGSDMEERIDAITQHWDIIMRTLTHLQSVVATAVFALLKRVDLGSPEPFSSSTMSHASRTLSFSGRRSEDEIYTKPPKTNAKLVTLLPNCLMESTRIRIEVESSKTRIATGLRASRVVTGQNRWGIWREEARWVARWASGREQGFFFNLLTGFLATHTDWLQALSPAWYRKRHLLQQKAKGEEDMTLPGRTVVVAQDKMAARRLIFLLSSFLGASQQVPTLRSHRPSTSASWGAFSQSPPSYVVPILKEESLRRKINRRTGPRRASHSRNISQTGQGSRGSGVPAHVSHLSMDRGHERRPSDAASIKTTNLPIPGSDTNTRKSSAATTATIVPEATTAHFTTAQARDHPLQVRPGSSSSVAADDLKRTLRRGDGGGLYRTDSMESRRSSPWSSVISGLWSTRRRDSTHTTAHTRDSLSSRDEVPVSPTKAFRRGSESLSRMAREAQAAESPVRDHPVDMASAVEGVDPQTPQLPNVSPEVGVSNLGTESFRRRPDPAGAFESPVRTSINAEDGVIDVEVPLPDYLTAFDTAVSSPSSSGYLSTPGFGGGLDAFEQSCRITIDGDVPMNVAGWLQRYHPDFILQALPPQADVMEQIKASLRAEPTPPAPAQSLSLEPQHERWVNMSNVIVADTTTFTITRLRYRRLVRPKPSAHKDTPSLSGAANPYNSATLTPAISPYETQLEEEFIEEPIVTLDEGLIEAVERVLAHSGDVSKGSSNCSSRSASVRRARSNSESTEPDDQQRPRLPPPTQGEVPRGECKTVVLSALEEIVREVINAKHREGEPSAETREKESALRGAVRLWLESVELGD